MICAKLVSEASAQESIISPASGAAAPIETGTCLRIIELRAPSSIGNAHVAVPAVPRLPATSVASARALAAIASAAAFAAAAVLAAAIPAAVVGAFVFAAGATIGTGGASVIWNAISLNNE